MGPVFRKSYRWFNRTWHDQMTRGTGDNRPSHGNFMCMLSSCRLQYCSEFLTSFHFMRDSLFDQVNSWKRPSICGLRTTEAFSHLDSMSRFKGPDMGDILVRFASGAEYPCNPDCPQGCQIKSCSSLSPAIVFNHSPLEILNSEAFANVSVWTPELTFLKCF